MTTSWGTPQNVRDTWTGGAKFECQFHEDTRIIASKVCQKQYTTMACILRQHSSTLWPACKICYWIMSKSLSYGPSTCVMVKLFGLT
jgi:hypothetical protein